MNKRKLTFRKTVNYILCLSATLATVLGLAMLLWILYIITIKGYHSISWTFLTEQTKPYGIPNSGIGNAILGTMMITFGATVLAVPAGLLGGVYLAEFGDDRKLSKIIKFFANVMMGIPAIIIGLFVYSLIVLNSGNFSGFAGSVALAIIMFPVIIRTTEDMLKMVPNQLRESALAIGIPRWRMTIQIIFRQAKNGLITGVLLAIARVGGEMAPLLFTALWSDSWPTNYFTGPIASLTILIGEYATNSPYEAIQEKAWSAALIVTTMILTVNLSCRFIFGDKKK